MAQRNWARIGRKWFPIASLAKGQEVVLFANEDQTVMWIEEAPTKATKAQRKVHNGEYDKDGNQVLVDETVTATFWSPAEFTD